ncbi:MAG: DUF4340 domain-containing protein [Nitrospiraceae bacterium]|nr:MAG: DUF4340 domain-containing protein [Nitrospiraceae bacterium]
MKGKKEFAILFFLIVVLVFYIKSEKGDKTRYDLPDITNIETKDVTGININKKDSVTTLIRENDIWLVGTQKYPADPSAVDKMLNDISSLSLTALASESRNYSIYELDDDKKIEIRILKGDDVIRTVSIGKPASSYRHTFVMIDDDHRVYHAEGNIRADFDRSIPDLRDKRVMAVQDEIHELTLEKGDKKMTIIKAASPVSVDVTDSQKEESAPEVTAPKWTTSDGMKVKDNEVESIINSLSDYQCDEFIDGKTREDFTSPVYTATFKGVKEYSISFYEKQDEKYPAVTSENDYPFMVSEWKANKIMKDLDSLLDTGQ